MYAFVGVGREYPDFWRVIAEACLPVPIAGRTDVAKMVMDGFARSGMGGREYASFAAAGRGDFFDIAGSAPVRMRDYPSAMPRIIFGAFSRGR